MKAKLHKLPSGLRVVFAQMPDSLTTTVEVLVETGSKYEAKNEAGLSHFLEHMCFKGTKKRPTSLDVSRAFDEIGAVNNAFTSTEITGYWAKAGYKELPKILELVSDIYLNTIFKTEDLEKEKGVIIEELNMYEDNPSSVVYELFNLELHGTQPAGLPVIGNRKSIKSFSLENFLKYRSEHYVASATTLVVAGRFNEKKTLAMIRKLFGDISESRKEGKKRTEIKHRGPRVVSKYKKIDQANMLMGFRAFPYGDKRNMARNVLRSVLSSGMSSRLFHKMRTELAICYSVWASVSASTDHGEFMVGAGVDPKRIEEAVTGILVELKRLRDELVPARELEKAKNSMISKMYMALETSDNVADYASERAIFLKDLKTPETIEKEIRAVKAEDIRKVAKEIFTTQDLVLAVVGKQVNKARLKKALVL
jgi:predicted Zn-dependent peptidase